MEELGFILGGLDYGPAIDNIRAAHPGLNWESGGPTDGPLAELRAVRRELMLAKIAIVREAEEPFIKVAEATTGNEATGFDLAPIVIIQATEAQADQLALRPDVADVRLSPVPDLGMASAYADVQASYSHTTLGFNGTGVRIGVVEYGRVDWSRPGLAQVGANKIELRVTGTYPNLSCVVGAPTVAISQHMTQVTAIAAGRAAAGTTSGIAPGAFIVSSSADVSNVGDQLADRRVIQAVECALINGDADLISTSLVQNIDQALGEAYFDHLVYEHHILSVSIAGNQVTGSMQCPSYVVRSPGSGWNVLTVGGMNDNNDASMNWANDEPWYNASTGTTPGYCYLEPAAETGDPVNDRVKPEMLAPGKDIAIAGYASGSGTSFAAPMVSGAAALVMDQSPVLLTWPETTKAILLAGSRAHRVDPRGSATFSTSLEGAGSLTTKWANLLVAGQTPGGGSTDLGGYGLTTLVSPAMQNGCWVAPPVKTIQFYGGGGRKLRFLIDWNSHTSGHASTSDTRYADLDLSILNPVGAVITPDATSWSLKWASNVEWVDFTVGVAGVHTARIYSSRWGCGVQSERMGTAWVSFSSP